MSWLEWSSCQGGRRDPEPKQKKNTSPRWCFPDVNSVRLTSDSSWKSRFVWQQQSCTNRILDFYNNETAVCVYHASAKLSYCPNELQPCFLRFIFVYVYLYIVYAFIYTVMLYLHMLLSYSKHILRNKISQGLWLRYMTTAGQLKQEFTARFKTKLDQIICLKVRFTKYQACRCYVAAL